MEIQKLIDKRAELWNAAKTFLDEHTNEDGKISAEDAATYDKMESEIMDLSKNIERFQRQAAQDKNFSQPITKPILNNPQENQKIKIGRASDEYKAAALNAMRTKFKNVSNILQEQVASDGGYLVPEEMDSRLLDVLQEENIFRQLATVITTSGEHKINITADKPAALWVAEGGALTFGDAKFAQKTLDAHKLHVGVKVTNELLNDNAFNLENYIIDQFGKAIGNAEEDAFINGTGAGQPTGILTTAAADSEMTLTTAGANISADDILNLVYKLKRPYRKNAVFLVNDATLAAIRKLKDANQAYMWQPSLQVGEPDRLLGYSIYTSIFMPTIAAGNMILAFGDFSYYNIGDRGTRTFNELREIYMPNDQTGFLMMERVDGILLLNESMKILQIKS